MTHPATARTNEEWLAALGANPVDNNAVRALQDFLRRGLYKAFSARSDVVDADIQDFAQDGVIRVLDRLDSFRGDSRFTTWAMSIAVNVAFAAMRKKSWGERTLSDLGIDALEAPAVKASESPVALAGMVREDVLSAMRQALETALTPRQRAALLAELAGMPPQTILKELNTTPGALYKLYHDARKKLRIALENAGFSANEVMEALQSASQE